MSIEMLLRLAQNLASVTDLKEIQAPRSLCCDFGGNKTFTTRWSDGRVQVWVQVWAPACHLEITKRRFWLQSQWLSSWCQLQHSLGGPGRQGSDGRARTQGVSGWVAVAAGHHRLAWGKSATTLAILSQNYYWLGSRVKTVSMLCKLWAVTTNFFLIRNEIFDEVG